jgi:hypothetical protein
MVISSSRHGRVEPFYAGVLSVDITLPYQPRHAENGSSDKAAESSSRGRSICAEMRFHREAV